MITGCLLLALCVTASTMIGLFRYKRKKSRVQYYASCLSLTDKLICDVSYRRDALPSVLREFAENDKSELKALVLSFARAPFAPFEPKTSLLSAGDKGLLCDFFSSLGTTDGKTQLLALEGYRARFAQKHATEQEKFAKTGGMELKLWFLLGLALGILLL